MNDTYLMIAKTMKGLEAVLADELRALGAKNVMPGRRMVQFEGNLETMYKANLCCRTALRILKPFYTFEAHDPDEIYEKVKDFEWSQLLSLDKTFCIDTVSYSDELTHSHFVTYRIKDAIVDWFRDRFGADKRPGVKLQDADVIINAHISGSKVTLSLDSSGESLHKRGYRKAQTEAPINEVLAAGIILMSGWRGDTVLVDPMCGSGTFLIEAALIAANINPGIYRKGFAFENWKDFDGELFDRLYNDDSHEREVKFKIYGSDLSPKAIAVSRENIKSAGVGKYIELEVKPLSQWTEAPVGDPSAPGVLITNPPYGERITAREGLDSLYTTLGSKLKNVFKGYHAWVIGYRDEYFKNIGLAPSQKIPMLNGSLDCELREYVIFEGNKRDFLASGGKLKREKKEEHKPTRQSDRRAPGHKPFKGHRQETPGERFADAFRKADARGSFSRRRTDAPSERSFTPSSDNPLAKRRNEGALLSIQGRKPSLPPQEGPMMRSRGWKKRTFGSENKDNNDNKE